MFCRKLRGVSSKCFKGLYTLVFEKKSGFLRFFFGKTTHFFFKLNAYLFIHVEKSFTNFFKKKKFIAGVNIAIVLKHNFPDISCGEHDKEGTAYLKYTKQKQNCSWYLYAVRERRILWNSFFYKNGDRFSKNFDFRTSELSVFAVRKKSFAWRKTLRAQPFSRTYYCWRCVCNVRVSNLDTL